MSRKREKALLPFCTLAIYMFDMFQDRYMRLICLGAIKWWVCAYRVLLRRRWGLTKFEEARNSNILSCVEKRPR